MRAVAWDCRTVGDWAREIDGADVVINLAGRSVNCGYTEENMRAMMTAATIPRVPHLAHRYPRRRDELERGPAS